ncbi:MAG: DUF1349 domain-containing protein [Bacteroidota bacterium]
MMMNTQVTAQTNLETLNDEFNESTSLTVWQFFHKAEDWPNFVSKADINTTTQGCLHMEPKTGFWYADVHSGPYLYKTLEGDFTVVTKVKANGKNTAVPKQPFSLAGLMVRSPRPYGADKFTKNLENWLFISTGYAKGKHQPQFETKVTINSKSNLKILPAQQDWVEIAITRIGNDFFMSHKLENGQWQIVRKVTHPNMADALQIGLIAYTDFNGKMKRRWIFSRKKLNTVVYEDGNPDLIARFEYVRFYRPKVDAKQYLENAEVLVNYLSLP